MTNFKSCVLSSVLCALAAASPIVEERQAVGQIINSCTVRGTVAIAFDDGAAQYTSQALDLLDRAGMKGTFFVNGQNYDNIYNNAAVIRRMANSGHQVASHTWAHADLSTLDAGGITSQMTQLETALTSIIGKYPTYMRPPYFGTNALVLRTLGGLGYKVIQSNLDTKDYLYQSAGSIQTSINIARNGLNSGGNLFLMHDPLVFTVQNLLPAVISEVRARGLRAVTVGECLGDAAGNWYATGRGGSTTPPPTSGGGGVSTNGQCGGSGRTTCPASQCCSQYGWCGTSNDHCAAGCQSAFGRCGSGTTPPPSGGGSVDPSGKCGGSTGFVCASGQCCSQWGWCGAGRDYCG